MRTTEEKEKFPRYKQELILLEEKDQDELRGHQKALDAARSEDEKKRQGMLLAKHCHIRARRMLEILREIEMPTVENIGLEGSKAVSLLALHSYLSVMKKVLGKYQAGYRKSPSGIYYQAIPPLTDRITILEYKIQYFGTNWYKDRDGLFFLVPVKDFATMNQRRAKYGLGPAQKPVILSFGAPKYPAGRGEAVESDQKELSHEEYVAYSQYNLKSMV